MASSGLSETSRNATLGSKHLCFVAFKAQNATIS